MLVILTLNGADVKPFGFPPIFVALDVQTLRRHQDESLQSDRDKTAVDYAKPYGYANRTLVQYARTGSLGN